MNSKIQIPSQFKLKVLAQIIDGKVIGDEELMLNGFNAEPLNATAEQLCFVFSPKYLKFLEQGKIKAGACVIPTKANVSTDISCVAVRRPKLAIRKLLELIAPKRFSPNTGIHPSAVIAPDVKLGKHVRIGAHVSIEKGSVIGDRTEIQAGCRIGAEVTIGQKCLLCSNVVVEDFCEIGNEVIIHAGAIIGSDGYSYVTEEESALDNVEISFKTAIDPSKVIDQPYLKVTSAGSVQIHDKVEIGSNSCIDRGTLGPTIIGEGSKIDNLVQIAHNCKIGKNCLIAGQSSLAGSVIMEDRSIIAGASGCRDNITVGHDSVLLGASNAHKDIKPYAVMFGTPATTMEEYFAKPRKQRHALNKIPQLEAKIEQLEKQLQALQKKS